MTDSRITSRSDLIGTPPTSSPLYIVDISNRTGESPKGTKPNFGIDMFRMPHFIQPRRLLISRAETTHFRAFQLGAT
ncbi:hypothetical protein OK349_08010 [Sphingomonas sp. BT-65]|uniref:hypothetical protein n=1 Tax=Sphingomonas sp. BT-65 TaxID=2989821 RepID=UPI002235FA4F|nr:hypothetical protein [Sphingomonas sp. BT-65]MCW4461650.1 hypothetical protein [Sphingomonas sp. BT-65]